MQEPQRAGHVLAGRAGDGRHAERVAIDADIRGQSGDRGGAVDLRQAGAHLRAGIQTAAGNNQHGQDDQQNQDDAAN